jgi:hypothetical protein
MLVNACIENLAHQKRFDFPRSQKSDLSLLKHRDRHSMQRGVLEAATGRQGGAARKDYESHPTIHAIFSSPRLSAGILLHR